MASMIELPIHQLFWEIADYHKKKSNKQGQRKKEGSHTPNLEIKVPNENINNKRWMMLKNSGDKWRSSSIRNHIIQEKECNA